MIMTKKYYPTNELIDLMDLLLLIWKKKIFVLISIISFSIAFVVYSKINYAAPLKEARITLKDPQSTNIHFEVGYKFYDEFVKNLLSRDNLIIYLESRNDKDSEELKKKLTIDNRIFVGLVESNSKVDNSKFYFRYPKNLNGESIFNNYVIFTAENEMKKFLNFKKNEISFIIERTEKNILIATKLEIEKPIFNVNNMNINIFDNKRTVLDDLGFYKGTIVLSEELKELNRLKNNLHAINVKYDVILDKAKFYYHVETNYSVLSMAILGMLTGFLLSILVLFFNFSLMKK